jgi:hypothetical protein
VVWFAQSTSLVHSHKLLHRITNVDIVQRRMVKLLLISDLGGMWKEEIFV